MHIDGSTKLSLVGSGISTSIGTAMTLGDLHHIMGIVGILFGMAMGVTGLVLQVFSARKKRDDD